MLHIADILNGELFAYFSEDLLYFSAASPDDSEIVDIYGDRFGFILRMNSPILQEDMEANCF